MNEVEIQLEKCKKKVFIASMAFSSSELIFLRDSSQDNHPVLCTSAADDELGVMGCTDLSADVSGINSPSF